MDIDLTAACLFAGLRIMKDIFHAKRKAGNIDRTVHPPTEHPLCIFTTPRDTENYLIQNLAKIKIYISFTYKVFS